MRPGGQFCRKLLPPARVFYERELGRLSRPDRKGWARGNCPFHESKSKLSFSVNLDSGGYFCHGCQVHGDMVGFVMARYGLDFKEASKYLNAWDETGTITRDQVRAHQRAREKEPAAIREKQEAERQELIDARTWLHATRELFEDARRDHDIDLMAEFLPALRQAEDHYCELAGIEVPFGE